MRSPRRIHESMPVGIPAKLVSLTKSHNIEWINLENLKEYFDDDGMMLDDHPVFSTYFSYLREHHCRPVSSQTYITYNASDVYILSRYAHSSDFHLDMAAAGFRPYMWKPIHSDQVTLLRLLNVIRIVDPDDSRQSIENMLYAIDDIRV